MAYSVTDSLDSVRQSTAQHSKMPSGAYFSVDLTHDTQLSITTTTVVL